MVSMKYMNRNHQKVIGCPVSYVKTGVELIIQNQCTCHYSEDV